MCNPLAIAAVAATAVGTGLQIRAQNQREEEMNKLQRRETERQEDIYKRARPLLEENQAEYSRENVESEQAAAAAQRAAEYDAQNFNAPRANEALPGSTQTSNVVVLDAFKKALGDAAARAGAAGQARAKLSAFGDVMGQNAIENNRRSDQLGMFGSFSQGSAGVLPMELQHAATRRRGAATAGNILTGVGSAMMGSAGSAGSGAAGASGSGAGNWGSLFGGWGGV